MIALLFMPALIASQSRATLPLALRCELLNANSRTLDIDLIHPDILTDDVGQVEGSYPFDRIAANGDHKRDCLDDLVAWGINHVSELANCVGDDTPTTLELFGKVPRHFYDPRKLAYRGPWWPGAERDPDLVGKNKYTVTIGDVCFFALGRVVNRWFFPTMYGADLNSPQEYPDLVKFCKRDYGHMTTRDLVVQLKADILWPDSIVREFYATRRLMSIDRPLAIKVAIRRLKEERTAGARYASGWIGRFGYPTLALALSDVSDANVLAEFRLTLRSLANGAESPIDPYSELEVAARLVGDAKSRPNVRRYCERRIRALAPDNGWRADYEKILAKLDAVEREGAGRRHEAPVLRLNRLSVFSQRRYKRSARPFAMAAAAAVSPAAPIERKERMDNAGKVAQKELAKASCQSTVSSDRLALSFSQSYARKLFPIVDRALRNEKASASVDLGVVSVLVSAKRYAIAQAELKNSLLGYFSSLPPRSTTLASACYLFQGFPGGVFGEEFFYDSPQLKLFEDSLADLLTKHTPAARLGAPEVLRSLTGSLFLRDHYQPVFVMQDRERVALTIALKRELPYAGQESAERVLTLAMLSYLVSKVSPDEKSRYISQIGTGGANGEVSRVILNNVVRVSKSLSFQPAWANGLTRPYPIP